MTTTTTTNTVPAPTATGTPTGSAESEACAPPPTTRIAIIAAEPRARVELVAGALAPRLIERTANRAVVAVAAAQMLLLDGDAVRIEVEVGAGAVLEIEDIGGTVAYPGCSSWTLAVRVDDGGRLLWRGLPFVVAGDADVERRTELHLGDGAAVLLRETLVLGRYGELGGAIRSHSRIAGSDGPVLIETLAADATKPEAGVLGGHRVFDSVMAIGYRPTSGEGALVLDAEGAIARRLGSATHASDLDAVWTRWKEELESVLVSSLG